MARCFSIGLLSSLVCSAIAGLPQLSDRTLRRLQQAVVAASIIGAGVLFFEVLSHGLIERVLFSNITWLRPDPKHIQVVDGRVTAIGPYMLNRNMAALCLVIWPSLLMLRTLCGAQTARNIGLPLTWRGRGCDIAVGPCDTSAIAHNAREA